VTRASNRLKATGAAGRMKRPGAAVAGRIAKPKGLQRDPQAAAKLAAGRKGPAAAGATTRGRQPNLKAQRAKEMANRTRVVPGRMFNDGQDVRTLSLAQMRAAVRQRLRSGGIETRKQYQVFYGKPPTTRSGWEEMYRQVVTSPQSDRNLKPRRGVVNGMDVQKSFRPWQVFGLNPKTATRADVEQAYRRVAKQVHPDAGGRRRDFERVKTMRDSVLALMPQPKAPKGRGKGAAKAKASAPAAPAAPQGPKLLPPARGTGARNAVTASPRRLNSQERAVASVMANSKFKSDAAKRRELTRLGFSMNQEQLLQASNQVRRKISLSPMADRNTARQALDRATGATPPARKPRRKPKPKP
jgi:hypothetical protein